ncbi:hypothetical protein ACQJBY_004501 [Aegilops geniculata]
MPGSIRVSDIQPPVAAPLFLQVNLGKKVFSGYIGQDGFSFPVTSLRDSMVLSLYDADKELVSKTEVKTRSIVELGSTDVVFSLDSGGQIILQLQFLLSDEDRKRIQEMRNSAMKRKQQELFGNSDELYFQESTPPKDQAEEISDIPSKEDPLMLRKSMSTDDLKRRVVFSEIIIGSETRSGRHAATIISNKKPSASRQAGLLNAQESRRRSSSRRDRAAKTSMGEGAEKQNHHRRSIAPMHPGATSSIAWTGHPHICITTASRQLKDLVGLEHLNSMKNAQQSAREEDTEEGTSNDDAVGSKRRRFYGFPALNGWLINQGVRGVIVIIACGAVFLNNM